MAEKGIETQESAPKATGFSDRLVALLFWGTLLLLLGIYFAQFRTPLWESWDPAAFAYPAAHVAAAGFMLVVWHLHQKRPRVPEWLTAVLLFAGFAIAGYYFHTRALEISFRPVFGSIPDMALAVLMFAQVTYLSWRYWGPIFPVLGFVFVGYMFVADLLPGPFHGPSFETQQILSRIGQKMFANIMDIAARFLWLLVFWGLLMNTAGGGIALLGLARLLSRGIAGGPAMGCVIASAVTGSFVGGGTSNVAITGPITIPAMRRAGYTANEAAAIEAMASNASSITPPILGAVAFIMSDVIGVSYLEIIVMSIVPALLWFLAVGIWIYSHAQLNTGVIVPISADPAAEGRVNAFLYLRSSLLIMLPVTVIMYYVLQGYTLRTAAMGGFITLVILAVVLRVETRWSVWSQGLRQAAFYASSVTIILVIVALMSDAITWTGLGGRLGGIIEDASQGKVLIAGVIMIVFGVVLGAGLPALAIYFIMAVTFAPVLMRMGVDFRVSHYTAFYIGTLSAIIPPIAASALVAAAVAQTKYWPVCKVLIRVSWPLWVFPLLFLVAPELLLLGDSGSATTILVIASSAMVIIGVQVATAGWLIRPLALVQRAILYANFLVLVVALRQDLELLMGICIAVVVGVGASSLVLKGRPKEKASIAPSGSGSPGA
jgi:TRAP transporter 4TM/12TM fusion protein